MQESESTNIKKNIWIIPWKKVAIGFIIFLAAAIYAVYMNNRTEYHPWMVRSIIFCDTAEHGRFEQELDVPDLAPDATAWLKKTGDDYCLYIGQEGGVTAGEKAPHFGEMYPYVEKIQFDGNYDTSTVSSMDSMFAGCRELKELDVSTLNTTYVTNMKNMFMDCRSLTELQLGNFDTGEVNSMDSMFAGCSSLQELNMSSFSTTMVLDMASMFADCTGLTELDLSNFEVWNLINMTSMFENCTNLKKLDLSSFQFVVLPNVYCTHAMFKNCISLAALNASDDQILEQYLTDCHEWMSPEDKAEITAQTEAAETTSTPTPTPEYHEDIELSVSETQREALRAADDAYSTVLGMGTDSDEDLYVNIAGIENVCDKIQEIYVANKQVDVNDWKPHRYFIDDVLRIKCFPSGPESYAFIYFNRDGSILKTNTSGGDMYSEYYFSGQTPIYFVCGHSDGNIKEKTLRPEWNESLSELFDKAMEGE